MNKLLFIVEQNAPIINYLGVTNYIEYYNQSSDKEITEWLISNKKLFENKEKIIIPCCLGTNDTTYHGIYIATHIRLTKELSKERLLPIVFYNADSKGYILQKQINESQLKTSLLLYTKGCTLIQDPNNISSIDLEAISENELISDVLPNLTLFQTRDSGHKLANEWGVFRLAEYANLKLDIEKPTSLYTKYKDSYIKSKLKVSSTKIGLCKKTCNALLIDDKADKGWFKVVEFILRNRIVDPSLDVTLDVKRSYEEAIEITDYHKFDIIFLDLRLYDWEDSSSQRIPLEKFSGARLLKKIKDENLGIQVIIFTASNKIWNIDKLKELGADCYYIKESPEFIPNESFSQINYDELIRSIEICLSRKPLKNIFSSINIIKSHINNSVAKSTISQQLKREINIQIDLSYKLISEAKEDNQYAVSYIVLYRCIELIADYFTMKDTNGKWILKDGRKMIIYEYSSSSKTYKLSTKSIEPSTSHKLIAFAKQSLALQDRFLLNYYWDNFRRNTFIHFGKPSKPEEKAEYKSIFGYNGFSSLLSFIELIFKEISNKR